MNPEVEFSLTEIPVDGLWHALGIQIFTTVGTVRGQSVPRDPIIWCDGRIYPFVNSVGGWGLMSAVVVGDKLYYSYSFGSGIHRSHVGRLVLKDRIPACTDSEARMHGDLFVERTADGRVRVSHGEYRGFNRWEHSRPIGWIDVRELTRVKVIDGDRHEVELGRIK
jgi:hypothetical protein